MKWAAVALVLLTLPLFLVLVRQGRTRRNQAVMAIGLFTFLVGDLRTEPALIAWSWSGISSGVLLSPVDTLAIALIATRRYVWRGQPFRLLQALYLVPVTLSLAFAATPLASTFTLAQLLHVMILFVAVAGELDRPGALRSLLAGLSLGLIVQAVFVIDQKLSGVVQATGTVAHQNTLGLMVELAVLPLVAAVLEGDRRKLVYAGIAAGLIVVAGGGSRATTAFVGAGIVVLTLLALARRPTPRKFQMVGLGAVALAVFAALSFATLKDRFGGTSFETDEHARIAYEETARAIAADYPFGVGANHFVIVSNTEGYAAKAGVPWNSSTRARPVHNAYLLARAETGWAGQLALMALFLFPVAAGLRLAFARRIGSAEGIVLGSAVAIATLAVHSNFEYAWHVREAQTLFFLDLAIIGGCLRAARIERSQQRRARRRERETAAETELEPALRSAAGAASSVRVSP